MVKSNNKWLLPFALGIIASLFMFPYLRLKGLSFDVLLVSLFGEGSIWALPFSLLVIATIIFGFRKYFSNKAV